MRTPLTANADCRLRIADWKIGIGFLCLLLASWPCLAFAAPCQSDGRYVMGTVLEITLCFADSAPRGRTFDTLYTTATRLDALFTTFSPESPLSRLNAKAGTGAVSVPSELADILSLSLQYWRLTKGTFDITVGPLMTLWRQAAATHTAPSASSIQHARNQVGSEKVLVFPHGQASLSHPGMMIDLGGIGKGYALDQMINTLKPQNVHGALLDFGQSSMWALGQPPDAPGWRLLIQQPNGHFVGIITLRDQALSTSGSLGQNFEVSGQSYGHVIDPRSGEPLQRDLLACVIAPSAAQAEALSKAVLILGEREGIPLLERLPGVEGLLVDANGQQWMTTGWIQAVAFTSL